MNSHSSTSSFKTRKYYILKYVIFFVLLFLLYITACAVVSALGAKYDARNSSQRVTKHQLEDFYSLPENSIDMLVLGSSHAMCSYDPFLIGEKNNLNVYNLGTALQQPDTGYYLFKEALKTQKPKYLLFDIYFKVMQNEKSAEQALTVLKEMKPSANRLGFFLLNLDFKTRADYLSNWFNPFGRIYSILEDIENNNTVTPPGAYRGRGYYVSDNVVTQDALLKENHPFPEEFKEFTPRQLRYVERIVRLARENGVEVVFVTAPIPPTILARIEYYDRIYEVCGALAEKLDVRYADFNIAMKTGHLSLNDTDFADQGHLSRAPADSRILTEVLPDILSD